MKRAKQINQLNDKELSLGYTNTSSSWHFQEKYNSSSYIYIGGLDYRLTEGDILTVFSQYGEIIDIDLIREEENKDYNKDYKDYNNNNKMSKGFCFLSYENIKSTILAIDNLNGIQLGDKIICVDHAPNYYKKVKNLEENDKEEEEEMIVYKVVNGERKIDHDEMKKRNVNWIHEYLMKELYY
ncbi:hypothetical protein ABK040_002744 [Willaertia magna]